MPSESLYIVVAEGEKFIISPSSNPGHWYTTKDPTRRFCLMSLASPPQRSAALGLHCAQSGEDPRLPWSQKPGMSQEGLSASLPFHCQPNAQWVSSCLWKSAWRTLQERGAPVYLARMRLCLLQLVGDQVFNYSATWSKIFSASFLKISRSLGLQIFSSFVCVCVCVCDTECVWVWVSMCMCFNLGRCLVLFLSIYIMFT